MSEKTVVCMKWGEAPYNSDYINRLYRGVTRHLTPPFRFICFTDSGADGLDSGIEARSLDALNFEQPITGMARKLALLHPKANLSGTCLFLDLDIVITGNLDDFFTYAGKFCIIHNWIERRKMIFRRRPLNGNSSVYRWQAGAHPEALAAHFARPDERPNQAFLTRAIGLENITWWPEEWVRSFKRHAQPLYPLNKFITPKIPRGCRILAFHGSPNPDDAIAGINCGGYKHSLPMPELARHWY